MTNDAIDRGIEALEEVRFKHTSYYQIRCVLEAMKEPDPEDKWCHKCGYCLNDCECNPDPISENFVEGYKKWEAKRGTTKEQS